MDTNQVSNSPQNHTMDQPLNTVPQPPIPEPVPTPPPASQKASSNTGMAVLAYIGILIVVPFFTDAKNDPFVKFHIKQGLVLIITWIAMSILSSMVSFALAAALSGHFFIGTLLAFLFPTIYLGLLIINIIGIVNAASGNQKDLPIIGKFAHNFNF